MIIKDNVKTIYDLLNQAKHNHGVNTFLRWEEQDIVKEISYTRFVDEAMGIAAWAQLENETYGHNVHIALMGISSKDYLTALLGIMANGNVVVPLDTQLNAAGLADNLNRAEVDILIYDWEHHDLIKEALVQCDHMIRAICFQPREKKICYKDILESHIGSNVPPKAGPDELAMILFTSGTTGRGKGVMLSQGNLIDNVFCTTDSRDLSSEVYLSVLPIHHVFCINGDVLITLRYGYVLCLNRDLSKLVPHLLLFQPTFVRMVPMMARTLYNRINILSIQTGKSLKECKALVYGERIERVICGGGYLPPDLAKFYQDIDVAIYQGYGMSECSPKITAPDWSRPDKVDTVGRPVDGIDIRFVEGEIRVKSPSVMMGYYHDEEETRAVFDQDGYLMTGDMGFMDDEGFVHFTGRKKNLIVLSNGENVAPEELENLFSNEPLIEDILVYDDEDTIAAEIYPDFKYVEAKGIKDLEKEMKDIIDIHNESLPTFKRIMRHNIRRIPFEKTSSKKIKRNVFFDTKKKEKEEQKTYKMPENPTQEAIYEILSTNLGHRRFGIDTSIFDAGMDSMGSVMLLTDLFETMGLSITLKQLKNYPTVLKLEEFIKESEKEEKVDYAKREVYPLTNLQMFFGYVMRGNTTSNLPFLFKLSPAVDIKRLKKAAEDVFEVHPELKCIIQPGEKMLMNFRDDERKIDIPIKEVSAKEWDELKDNLVVPFMHTPGEDLFHSAIYVVKETGDHYFFMDIAHIMGDGMSLNVLYEDINRLYAGEDVPREKYTFYEYILDEIDRTERGIKAEYMKYLQGLMRDYRIRKSIFTKALPEFSKKGENNALKNRFENTSRNKVTAFCRKNGISENALFLTAFSYCLALFSGDKDALCSSIHSGRTDSRWNRLTGVLFTSYPFRYRVLQNEAVEELLKRCASQILQTMDITMGTLNANDYLIQFQGDILNIDEIGGEPAERMPIVLDSRPFHLMIYNDDKGYFYSLRFWENRFDKAQLEILMEVYETILNAMLEEHSVRRLRSYIHEDCIPKHFTIPAGELWKSVGRKLIENVGDTAPLRVYILNDRFQKQPYGGWGDMYIAEYAPENYLDVIDSPYREGDLYMTGITARINPDGGVDTLDKAGRTVQYEGLMGREFINFKTIEDLVCEMDGVERAESYVLYGAENRFYINVRIYGSEEITLEDVNAHLDGKIEKGWMPHALVYGGPA